MTIFSFFSRIFNWIIILLVELVLFFGILYVNFIDFGKVQEYLVDNNGRIWLSILLIGLIGVSIIVIFQKIHNLRYQKNIKFEDSAGEVIISLTSLERCLEKMLETESDVHAAKVYIFVDMSKKSEIHCWARISIEERKDIPARSVTLRKMIRRRISEILPIQEEINLVAELKVVPGRKGQGNKDGYAAEDLSQFHGSQYPIWE